MTEIEIEPDNKINNQSNNKVQNSKVGIGVLLGFMGLIGLLIGILLYREDTTERQTFIKGWLWCFIITMVVGAILGIIFYAISLNHIKNMANSLLLWK